MATHLAARAAELGLPYVMISPAGIHIDRRRVDVFYPVERRISRIIQHYVLIYFSAVFTILGGIVLLARPLASSQAHTEQ